MNIKYLLECCLLVIVVNEIAVDSRNVTANKVDDDESAAAAALESFQDFPSNLLSALLGALRLQASPAAAAVDYQVGCEVDVRSDLGNPQPLYIRPNSTQIFHPSDRSGTLKLEKSQQIELFCTNGFVSPRGIVDRSLVTLECAYENLFITNGRSFRLNEFACRKNPYFSVRQRPRQSLGRDDGRCFNNSTLLDVGFAVSAQRFIVVFTVCFNPITEQTYYAKYRLTPANAAAQQGFNRPKFIQGDYFPGKDINDLYSRASQRQLLTDVLRSDELAEQLVEETGNIFMSRGHLAARGDFIYANEQRSTFNYINVAPQWQSFNGLNWRAVEDGSRRLAASRNISLDVYTGTHGVTMLRDIDGIPQEIHLDPDEEKVPVPAIFYRILIEPLSRSGVVLIGVNNPHLTLHEIKRDYVICNDISDKVKYIKWRARDIRRGYMYACDVNDFLRAVPHLLDMSVESVLL